MQEVGVVKPHSFASTGEEPEEYNVAIVASADGLSMEDLEKFADVGAINESSIEALVSGQLCCGKWTCRSF